MSRDKKNKKHYTNTKDHPILTRRDFLSRWGTGVVAGSLMFPGTGFASSSVESHFSEVDCSNNPNLDLASVCIVDLAGGGHLAGSNFIVGMGTDGAQDDLDYDVRGVGIGDNHLGVIGAIDESKIDTSLGIKMHADSALLEGIHSIIGSGANKYTNSVDGCIFCTTTFDDTTTNQTNISYWLSNLGCVGNFGAALGTKPTKSGGTSASPNHNKDSKFLPIPIQNEDSLRKLLEINRLANKQSTSDQKKLLKLIEEVNINGLYQRRDKFSDSLKNRLYCDYKIPYKVLNSFKIEQLLVASGGHVDQAFSPNGVDRSFERPFNSVDAFKIYSHLLNEKFFGVGTISIAGFDYHSGNRTLGDSNDRDFGINLGCLIKSTVDLGKNMVVIIITDGGVGTRLKSVSEDPVTGQLTWNGDRGTASAAVMLAINGEGGTRVEMNKRQIGRVQEYFAGNYEVANIQTDTLDHPLTSNGDIGLANGIFANYLALHGLEGDLKKYAGIDVFTDSSGKSVFGDYRAFGASFKKA